MLKKILLKIINPFGSRRIKLIYVYPGESILVASGLGSVYVRNEPEMPVTIGCEP